MKTPVVHVDSPAGFEVYIGRKAQESRHPQARDGSVWGNPFVIGRDGTREECLANYREYLMSRPDLLARLPELRGKILGCWRQAVAPGEPDQACHGDILAELADAAAEYSAGP